MSLYPNLRLNEVKIQMSDVRDQILLIIQDRAYKQAAIAQRAGLTPDQFCAVLKHRRKLDANEFLAVCTALGMKAEAVAEYGSEGAQTRTAGMEA